MAQIKEAHVTSLGHTTFKVTTPQNVILILAVMVGTAGVTTTTTITIATTCATEGQGTFFYHTYLLQVTESGNLSLDKVIPFG